MKAPSLLKKVMEALSSKTNELKIRIMIFFLLHKNALNKTTLTNSLTTKLHSLVASNNNHSKHLNKKNDDVLRDSHETDSLLSQEEDQESKSSLLMYYNKAEEVESVTHALFKESEVAMEVAEEEDGGDGVVEVAEDDINKAAALFIEKFRRQMQLQKLHSLDTNQQRLVQANA